MSDSDAALVARTLEGDLDAYGVLMARYRDSFGRYAFHMLGNYEDAQEAMQDSFVRAYRGIEDLPAARSVQRLALPHRGEPLPHGPAAPGAIPPVRRRASGRDPERGSGSGLVRMARGNRPGARAAPAPLPRGISAALCRRTGLRRDVEDDRGEGARAPNAGEARGRPAPRTPARRPCPLTTTTNCRTSCSAGSWPSCGGRSGWTPPWTLGHSGRSGTSRARRRARRRFWLGAAALAAGLFFAVLIRRPSPGSGGTTAAGHGPGGCETRQVELRLSAPASSVTVVGDFNDWDPSGTPLRPTGRSGVWSVELQLKPGRYHYTFLIDGNRWAGDPSEPQVTSDFGAPVSVLTVS